MLRVFCDLSKYIYFKSWTSFAQITVLKANTKTIRLQYHTAVLRRFRYFTGFLNIYIIMSFEMFLMTAAPHGYDSPWSTTGISQVIILYSHYATVQRTLWLLSLQTRD